MAGDWIKVECVTPDKPEVYRIAELCDIEPEHAFGALVCVWIWADSHTSNGDAVCVTKKQINRTACVTGFAEAMEQVGWLKIKPNGVIFPNFERHNGKSSKKRALTSRRNIEYKRRQRSGDAEGDAGSVNHGDAKETQNASPREEKRREENNSDDAYPEYLEVSPPPTDHPNGHDKNTFAMVPDWRPSTAFDAMLDFRQLPPETLTEAGLREFIQHWMTQPGRKLRQDVWEKKLVDSLIQYNRRNAASTDDIAAHNAEILARH